jgi:hypothetical protein
VVAITIILDIGNCLFPIYSENIWTEQSDGSYHEATGCLCSWEKEDFIYNAETEKWELSPNASRKRIKKDKRRRGGNGLR